MGYREPDYRSLYEDILSEFSEYGINNIEQEDRELYEELSDEFGDDV